MKRIRISEAEKKAARRHGEHHSESDGYEHIYQVQPLMVASGPHEGRICENDDDDFVFVFDRGFAGIAANYDIKGHLRYFVDDDGEEQFGIPCQIVYFGSTISVITLAGGQAVIPNFALRPANTNDFVERINQIDREIFEHVGSNIDEVELEWEEAFFLSTERSFILNELWTQEIFMRSNDNSTKNVFLCHASPDKWFVRRVAADLKKLGHEVWLDEFEIKAGESIVEKISLGTARADALILFVSQNSNKSDWVKREWQSVMSRKLSKEKQVQVIPVRIEECDVPPIMSDIKYADFSSDYTSGFGELRVALGGRDPN